MSVVSASDDIFMIPAELDCIPHFAELAAAGARVHPSFLGRSGPDTSLGDGSRKGSRQAARDVRGRPFFRGVASNTMPSSIKDAIKTTLKRHAQFGGFLGRQ